MLDELDSALKTHILSNLATFIATCWSDLTRDICNPSEKGSFVI